MYIELIDLLRCPREHDDTWLVAAFTKMDGRFIVTGKLGCPVCNSTFAIEKGRADLRLPDARDQGEHAAKSLTGHDPDSAVRLAAMLGLTRPGSLAVLSGAESSLARAVSELTDCRVIVLDPSDAIPDSERIAGIFAGRRIPLAAASVDGIVTTDSGAGLSDAVRVLKPGGRLVTSIQFALPPNCRELARDESYIVAELVGPLLKLSRQL